MQLSFDPVALAQFLTWVEQQAMATQYDAITAKNEAQYGRAKAVLRFCQDVRQQTTQVSVDADGLAGVDGAA